MHAGTTKMVGNTISKWTQDKVGTCHCDGSFGWIIWEEHESDNSFIHGPAMLWSFYPSIFQLPLSLVENLTPPSTANMPDTRNHLSFHEGYISFSEISWYQCAIVDVSYFSWLGFNRTWTCLLLDRFPCPPRSSNLHEDRVFSQEGPSDA